MLNLTPQQSTILAHIQATPGLTMIEAKAGTGKTTMLTAIAKSIPSSNSLYLCYNKALAVEASHKFPKSVHCCTTHSLAYKPTVIVHKLKLGTFTARSISEPHLPYDQRQSFIDSFRQFCLSSHTSFQSFATSESLPAYHVYLFDKYSTLMETGKAECTHDFYLKYFHLLLDSGSITYHPFDLVMLDEAGDLNEVTLAIFNLLPATRKVMVGDPYQNIYSFNHTINCFELMSGQGAVFPMSQSFRVADHIATRIEAFGIKYLSPTFTFTGTPSTDSTIHTRAYIARTNASLIDRMIELNASGTPYGLSRTAKQIFELPLCFCSLKYQGFISLPEYKHLQADIDDYYEHHTLDYTSLFSYLKHLHKDDFTLVKTISLIQRYGKAAIISCYEEARKHEKSCQSLTLTTCHAFKGAEVDQVELADDMNDAIADAVFIRSVSPTAPLPPELVTELYLYYVCVTRGRKSLLNAKHL